MISVPSIREINQVWESSRRGKRPNGFEKQDLVQETMAAALLGSHDLAHLLIAHCAKHHGCEAVLTFDNRASSHSLFELLRIGPE